MSEVAVVGKMKTLANGIMGALGSTALIAFFL